MVEFQYLTSNNNFELPNDTLLRSQNPSGFRRYTVWILAIKHSWKMKKKIKPQLVSMPWIPFAKGKNTSGVGTVKSCVTFIYHCHPICHHKLQKINQSGLENTVVIFDRFLWNSKEILIFSSLIFYWLFKDTIVFVDWANLDRQ